MRSSFRTQGPAEQFDANGISGRILVTAVRTSRRCIRPVRQATLARSLESIGAKRSWVRNRVGR
ncbi:hypothetical protein C8039_00110 [Halogeometricum sp. wsp3]|nr:hypothetical protein C8039_00110 [Halogeometricum sp. wsp3]